MRISVTPIAKAAGPEHEAANAAASATTTHYNGGVESASLARWYEAVLASEIAALGAPQAAAERD